MPCKYAFYFPAFLLVVVHFVVLHPYIQPHFEKLASVLKNMVNTIAQPFKTCR